jgi:hypothetical protein
MFAARRAVAVVLPVRAGYEPAMDPLEAWKQDEARALTRARDKFVSGLVYIAVAVAIAVVALWLVRGALGFVGVIAAIVSLGSGIRRLIGGGFDYVLRRAQS